MNEHALRYEVLLKLRSFVITRNVPDEIDAFDYALSLFEMYSVPIIPINKEHEELIDKLMNRNVTVNKILLKKDS